ncbi:TPR repeat protein-like protein [Dothidotthia symphoricarpi CBS 119687]|uniref:TPR repeat protein-like protein n=1 Tax=Dothidotthia symphoricarpi CBS 119687 TaxID=1392245 RepID=A0A6A6AUK9_9PLEO|nr:TPR repeat protein-like protein [Dothidotthia symphoricarpi CBS 119687]KAF2134624.1 TPR repeat protein-like protein [Dothidotthia symphoricarpi CBS 119687]
MAQQSPQNGAQQLSAEMPPAMAEIKSQSVDEVLKEMNRMPLFMTTLDETDGEGGENMMLEALKAMAYEGTRAEIAENFRQQGNECARAKQWTDAKEFYDKAIAALKGPQSKPDPEAEGPGVIEVELDEEEEAKKEKVIEEACYVNRALCNLEKKNYRSCIQDCASTLRVNPSNVKAFYRSSTACLSLDKLPEALDACDRGLALDPTNAPLKAVKTKISARQTHLAALEKARREREEKLASERATLALALKARGILTRKTDQPPDLEDAAVKLENAFDPSSTLHFPVIILYPTAGQSDFIKAFSEREKLDEHLEYIFPLPWDTDNEYTVGSVEAYMETVAGGLIKVGKKMSLGKVLGSGKPEVVDGLAKISVVPKDKAAGWIEEFKKRRGKN